MALVRRADGWGTDFGPIPMRREISGDGGVDYGPIIAWNLVLPLIESILIGNGKIPCLDYCTTLVDFLMSLKYMTEPELTL